MRVFLLSFVLAAAMTNADIVKLVQAGLSPETIEAKIRNSETQFDTSTDALVALAHDGVPDRVIRMMVEEAPAVPPVAPVPPVAAVPPAPPAPVAPPVPPKPVRRYEVAVHSAKDARCEGAELRIDAKGISAKNCRKLDFKLAWSDVKSACYDYGFRGTITLTTASGDRRFSTTTPAEAKKIVDTIRAAAPAVALTDCRPE